MAIVGGFIVSKKYTSQEKLSFKILIMELYRRKHSLVGSVVHDRFKEKLIFEYLDEFYDVLHTVSPEEVLEYVEERL